MSLLKTPSFYGVTRLRVRQYPQYLHLVTLEVDESLRGHGIGSCVITWLKTKRRPIRVQACADSDKAQPALNRFYRRNGFRRVESDCLPYMFEWIPTKGKQ